MFLKYKKIPKKAVRLSSFPHCSVHIFLGLCGGFWKINLRILWSYIMKNFQVKHGHCSSIIFPKTFSFESSKYLLDLCLANSRILYFWQVLATIHKFIIELHVLQCLFVGGLIERKGGAGFFQISQKERLFISYDNQVFLGVIS